jgi:hypothetical protein
MKHSHIWKESGYGLTRLVHARIVKYIGVHDETGHILWSLPDLLISFSLDLLNCIIQHFGPQDASEDLVAARYETGSHGLSRGWMD